MNATNIAILAGVLLLGISATAAVTGAQATRKTLQLPPPQTSGGMTLNEALARRRSIRRFTGRPLGGKNIAQLCWSAQGITHDANRKTAPSAGALYPLRLYVATADGVYLYIPNTNQLARVVNRDVRSGIARSAGKWTGRAGAIFVICGDVSITAAKYHARAQRYVYLEAGHVAQNLLLQATALGLGATPVGAFNDTVVTALLDLPRGFEAIYLVPAGQRTDTEAAD